MKKWWFSIICWVVAIGLGIYSLIALIWFDNDLFFRTTQIISSLSSILLLIIIGVANQPQKENKK